MRTIITIAIFLLLAINATGQYMVTDIQNLPPDKRQHIMPDVKGKVLVSSKSKLNSFNFNTEDTVTVFPLWPKSESGYNERGGIYCNLDDDPELEVVYTIGQSLYAYNIEGTDVPGWPVSLELIPDGAASYGDVDGDGFGEIVVTTHAVGSFSTGKVYAFEKNGSNVFGFPIDTEGGPVRTPVLADLDLDGADEIIISVRNWPDGFVHIYNGNGTPYEGWPVRMNDVPATTVAVGDITGDGIPEIIAASYTALYAYTTEGDILPGFPFIPGAGRVFSHSSPVLADLDGDGQREIIIGDHSSSSSNGKVHILKSDGSNFPNWPKTTEWWIYSPPSVGDINDDGSLDVIIADYFHEISTPVNRVYAWDAASGESHPGFPITTVYGVFSQLLLADVDGDNEVEILFDSNIGPDGIYCGYNHDGSVMEGWPVGVNGSTFTVNPFIADLNGDQLADFSGGGYDNNLDRTYVYLWETHSIMNQDKNHLTILQYNTRHNGVYGDYLMVGEQEISKPRNEMTIYPVPAANEIHINVHGLRHGVQLNVRVSGLNGKTVKQMSVRNYSFLWLDDLPPGTYVISIFEGTKFISAEKAIILNR
jgi:hypothetical protein